MTTILLDSLAEESVVPYTEIKIFCLCMKQKWKLCANGTVPFQPVGTTTRMKDFQTSSSWSKKFLEVLRVLLAFQTIEPNCWLNGKRLRFISSTSYPMRVLLFHCLQYTATLGAKSFCRPLSTVCFCSSK